MRNRSYDEAEGTKFITVVSRVGTHVKLNTLRSALSAMYYINKIVGFVISPVGLAIVGGIVALLCAWRKRFRASKWWGWFTALWLWFWSCGLAGRITALPLEREWPVVAAEDQPMADAIVVLGGGISVQRDGFPMPDLKQGADRAWYAARLYKAGKAPIVIPSNLNAEKSDNILLMDLGVPATSIKLESAARNTEENAKFVGEMLGKGKRILLVTSAWHMRRAVLMFKKYAPELEVIPAATDYEALSGFTPKLSWKDFLPDVGALVNNTAMVKEIVGYWGYRLLRK